MSTTTMNVSLPESMKAFIDEQVAREGYSSASEYIRALVREAQKQAAEAELEHALLQGLKGPVSPMTQDDWREIREQVEKRLQKRDRT
jgi:antitoxin ParD1/3/4